MKLAINNLAAIAALGLISFASAAHAQVRLDFENLSNANIPSGTNQQGSAVAQKGFTLSDSGGNSSVYSVSPDGGDLKFNYTKSVALFENKVGGSLRLARTNGAAFSLNSVDFANLFLQSRISGSTPITFTGSLAGGGTVTQTFTHGANDNLETATFGSDFTNLISVNIPQSGIPSQFDNFVLNSPVAAATPEPGSVALLVGMGVSGIAVLRRRRK